MKHTVPNKRSARKSRATRRAERNAISSVLRPALVRQLPDYEPHSAALTDEIHVAAMRIIEESGIEFHDPESLGLWRSVGATISGRNVRCSRDTVLGLMARAPAEFDLHARNSARTVRIGGPNSVVSPGYGAPFVLDFNGERRPSTLSDLRDFYRLTHMASAIQVNGGVIVEPQDIPVNLRHLHMVRAAFEDTDKPVLGPVASRQAAYDGIEMAKLVFGEAFVEKHPVMIGLITSNSPRLWSETMLESLKVYARSNQAMLVCPFTMIGASMPCNASATMALAVAEAGMAIALTQIIRPGAPVVMGLVSSNVSMRSGAPVFSSPVAHNFTFLAGQMARRYNLPWRATMCPSSSKWPDSYAGMESALSGITCLLSGCNFLVHGGGMLEGLLTMSYAKLALDYELVDFLHEMCAGLQLETADNILDMVMEAEPGGHYLGAEYTRSHYPCTPMLQDYNTFEQWLEEGCKNADTRGRIYARKMLDAYEGPALDEAIADSLHTYVEKRTREIES